MTQTLLVVVLFVGAVAMLPWLVRYLQRRRASEAATAGGYARVVSAVGVGPHQRVLTVEVGSAHTRACLVLGVTAQQITCLHVLSASGGAREDVAPELVASFSREMAAAQAPSGLRVGADHD